MQTHSAPVRRKKYVDTINNMESKPVKLASVRGKAVKSDTPGDSLTGSVFNPVGRGPPTDPIGAFNPVGAFNPLSSNENVSGEPNSAGGFSMPYESSFQLPSDSIPSQLQMDTNQMVDQNSQQQHPPASQ